MKSHIWGWWMIGERLDVLFHVSWQITVLPPFKHVNESFHIYLNPEINMNKHQKVFNFNRGTHHFSSLSPPKLICSSVWFVVKARRDTAAATGHVYLQNFQADNIMWNLWKWFQKSQKRHSFITLECRGDRLFAVKDLSQFNERENDMEWCEVNCIENRWTKFTGFCPQNDRSKF